MADLKWEIAIVSRNRKSAGGGFPGVFPPELFDPAGGINKLLLSGKKRMAAGTDLHVKRLASRPGVVDRSARAGDGACFVIWMDILLHQLPSLLMDRGS
jgi:hypothetical protein